MSNQYHLKTGEAGQQQLDALDRLYGQQSREFLHYIGLHPGMSVLDVGCGVGNLSCWLAEQVGSSGKVVAVDADQAQIDVASRRAEQQGIENISFTVADAQDLSSFTHQFDLVYCRWLLVHVKKPDIVVKNMANAVRSGGMFACEVGDLFSTYYTPEFASFTRLRDNITALLKKSGNDIHIAENIFQICKSLDDFSFAAKLSQGILHKAKQINTFTADFILVLDSMTEALISNNIMSPAEIDDTRQQLVNHSADKNTLAYLARMTQVWCKSTR